MPDQYGGRDSRWSALAGWSTGDPFLDERRKRMCLGKFAHETGYDAIDEIPKLAAKRDDLTVYDLSVYQCEFCDFFHIGTLKRRSGVGSWRSYEYEESDQIEETEEKC